MAEDDGLAHAPVIVIELRAVLGGELEHESGNRPGAVAAVRPGPRPRHRLAQVDVDEAAGRVRGEMMGPLQLHRNESHRDAEADLLGRRIDRGE